MFETKLKPLQSQLIYAEILKEAFGIKRRDIQIARAQCYGNWYKIELDRIRSMSQRELFVYVQTLYTQVHSISIKDRKTRNSLALYSLYVYANNLLHLTRKTRSNLNAYIPVE